MRIVVFGAGAVGSVIGGRLHQHAAAHDHEITLVARGPHARAITAGGLTIHDPGGTTVVDVPAVERIDQVPLDAGDIVILAMKTQGTEAALDALAAHAPPGISVACAQNGIENERLVLRRFADVQAICVMLPCAVPRTRRGRHARAAAQRDPRRGPLPHRRQRSQRGDRRGVRGGRLRQPRPPRRDALEAHQAAGQPAQRDRRAGRASRTTRARATWAGRRAPRASSASPPAA